MKSKRIIFTADKAHKHLRTDGRDRLTLCGKRMPNGIRASMVSRLETAAPRPSNVCVECWKIARDMIRMGINKAIAPKPRSQGLVEPLVLLEVDNDASPDFML